MIWHVTCLLSALSVLTFSICIPLHTWHVLSHIWTSWKNKLFDILSFTWVIKCLDFSYVISLGTSSACQTRKCTTHGKFLQLLLLKLVAMSHYLQIMSNTQFFHALFIYSESSHLVIVLFSEATWLLHYYDTVLDLLCERFIVL